jgi:ribose 5-phosphate isomerase B
MTKLVVASDHTGVALRTRLAQACGALGHQVTDLGPDSTDRVDYVDYAQLVCERIQSGTAELGLLVCGSGIGMQIAANRYPEVRAAVIHEHYSAEFARAHNDANVACFGARVVAPDFAVSVLERFLSTPFEGGRHQRRVDRLAHLGRAPVGVATVVDPSIS